MQLRVAAGSNDVDFGDVFIEFALALCFCSASSCKFFPEHRLHVVERPIQNSNRWLAISVQVELGIEDRADFMNAL